MVALPPPSSVSEEVILVREQIARNYGFTPPDAFVADLIAFVDGRAVAGWSAGRSDAFWQTLPARYGFVPTPEYVAALRKFVDDLEQMRADED